MELEPHFFRQESGRLVSALTRLFGLHNLSLAEDVTQDVLCRALETWKFRGIPRDPHAWLLTAAKNRTLDVLRRERTRRTFAPDVGYLLESEWTVAPALEEVFRPDALRDDILRMMFSCVHPQLSQESQVALILHLLCGFGVGEVAAAFLVGHAAMEKRLTRAKRVLTDSTRLFDLSQDQVKDRLEVVQRALYLLFNEGYHGAHSERAVRTELCQEAMRCTDMLLVHVSTASASTRALAALMCFLAARLPEKVDALGRLTRLEHQDRSRWDAGLIARGKTLLAEAIVDADGPSAYVYEAAIAGAHSATVEASRTPWPAIVSFYDALLRLQPSPVVALNRAVAVAEAEGPECGLAAVEAIPDREALARYPFYPATLGELERRRGRLQAARLHFEEALALARNDGEREALRRRILDCETGS